MLSIRHYGLGDAGANVFLATSLRSNKFLCILDLSDNFLLMQWHLRRQVLLRIITTAE